MKEISVAKGIRTQQFYRIVTWRNDRSSGENERLARSNLELIIKEQTNNNWKLKPGILGENSLTQTC